MEWISDEGPERYAALVQAAAQSVVGLDMDGTLSPIVEDPAQAWIHPDAAEVLVGLAAQVRAIAVVTGRPARQALALGGLDEVGTAIGDLGTPFHVFGQYGNEHWSSTEPRIIAPRPPRGLANLLRSLPSLLRRTGTFEAHVEEKGLAVAVHTRRLPDADAAFDRLSGPLADLAAANGLTVEPGRHVLEVRAPGTDKGDVVRAFAREQQAGGFLFAGDDLGDVVAFEAVGELRRAGMPALLVCSSSDEQHALLPLADVAVDGPAGVLDLLRRFTREAAARG